jgi:hypothetical protein
MASIIKAGNATDGVQVSSDATGALDIKTGTGAGTTAISIDASQVVTIPGSLIVAGQPAGGNYALESYVAPGTWTKPAGLKAVKVTVVGAGGAGGDALTTPATGRQGGASGGGGGGAAIEFIPAPSIPGPVSVTAGPGTNSFGAFCSATAGSAGTNLPIGIPNVSLAGGASGSGTGGDINISGGQGGYGNAGPSPGANVPSHSGLGGASLFGAGGAPVYSSGTTAIAGINGENYGGGGSGAAVRGPAGANGGTGAPGIVIVEEFY